MCAAFGAPSAEARSAEIPQPEHADKPSRKAQARRGAGRRLAWTGSKRLKRTNTKSKTNSNTQYTGAVQTPVNLKLNERRCLFEKKHRTEGDGYTSIMKD